MMWETFSPYLPSIYSSKGPIKAWCYLSQIWSCYWDKFNSSKNIILYFFFVTRHLKICTFNRVLLVWLIQNHCWCLISIFNLFIRVFNFYSKSLLMFNFYPILLISLAHYIPYLNYSINAYEFIYYCLNL
jgi:hypothetical protein